MSSRSFTSTLGLLALVGCTAVSTLPAPPIGTRDVASVQNTQSLRCEAIFNDPRDSALAYLKDLLDNYPLGALTPHRSETRASGPDEKGESLTLVSEATGVRTGNFSHLFEIDYYEVNREYLPPPLAALSRQAKNYFSKLRRECVRFVFGVYEDRRSHWTKSLFKKLLATSKEWERESTYIRSTVTPIDYDPEDPDADRRTKTHIASSIRLIHERDGRLPMEHYLGIDVTVPDGALKVEPGNFAIDKTAAEIGNVELSLGILSQVARYRREFGRSPFFATYADDYSEKLYGAMGFKYVTSEMMKILPEMRPFVTVDPKTGAVRIQRDGVTWAPMYATADMMKNTLDSRIKRTALHYKRNWLIKSYDELIARITAPQPTRTFRGYGTNTYMTQNSEFGFLSVTPDANGEARIDYLLPGEGDRRTGRPPLFVPIPIPEGYSVAGITNSHRITYSRGVLRIAFTFVDGSDVAQSSTEIVIDPLLKRPQRLRESHRSSDGQSTAEIEF